jgi:hypothetical protein
MKFHPDLKGNDLQTRERYSVTHRCASETNLYPDDPALIAIQPSGAIEFQCDSASNRNHLQGRKPKIDTPNFGARRTKNKVFFNPPYMPKERKNYLAVR